MAATAPHGGGAFSGKDPTKVDRSAAYAARYLAKNVVAAGLAERCTHPARLRDRRRRSAVDLFDTHGTGKVDEKKLEKVLPQAVRSDADATSAASRSSTGRSIARTSAYGHFGRTPEKDGGFSWEKTDLADALKRAV